MMEQKAILVETIFPISIIMKVIEIIAVILN